MYNNWQYIPKGCSIHINNMKDFSKVLKVDFIFWSISLEIHIFNYIMLPTVNLYSEILGIKIDDEKR